MSDLTSNLNLPPNPPHEDRTSEPAHAGDQPSAKPVAKVAAVGVGGAILVVVVAILSGIAPGTFDSLGVWGPLVATAVTALALFLSGYVKRS